MEKMMVKELNHLGQQDLFHNYMDELIQISDKELNKLQVDRGSALSTGIDCFGFGVMIGKRIERAKQRNNDELLTKIEILMQIETLKAKLEKLKSNI